MSLADFQYWHRKWRTTYLLSGGFPCKSSCKKHSGWLLDDSPVIAVWVTHPTEWVRLWTSLSSDRLVCHNENLLCGTQSCHKSVWGRDVAEGLRNKVHHGCSSGGEIVLCGSWLAICLQGSVSLAHLAVVVAVRSLVQVWLWEQLMESFLQLNTTQPSFILEKGSWAASVYPENGAGGGGGGFCDKMCEPQEDF